VHGGTSRGSSSQRFSISQPKRMCVDIGGGVLSDEDSRGKGSSIYPSYNLRLLFALLLPITLVLLREMMTVANMMGIFQFGVHYDIRGYHCFHTPLFSS